MNNINPISFNYQYIQQQPMMIDVANSNNNNNAQGFSLTCF